MAKQRELFTDVHVEWRLARRSVHIVPHATGTCYRIRIRWSQKLGLELQHDIYSMREAQRVVARIIARGAIQRDRWYAFFNPKWTATCRNLEIR